MGQGPQKPDHGGNFFMTPRRVTASVAWRNLSHRARSVLQVFQHAADGFNNGAIAFAIHDISTAIGDQNHGANSRAVAELIEKGFLEETCGENRAQSKAREYRLTFISTGKARTIEPATHEYADWRPVKKRKFGGARTATQNPDSGAQTATTKKVCDAVTATQATESRHFGDRFSGAETAPLLDNHSLYQFHEPKNSALAVKSPPDSRTAHSWLELDRLRTWANAVVEVHGYGGARMLAEAAQVPEVALSRFRNGRNLPDRYRVGLQEACSAVIRFDKLGFEEAAE